MFMMDMLIMLGIYVGFSLMVAQISKEKDVGFWTLFSVSMVLTPMVGLLVGLFSKRKQNQPQMNVVSKEPEKEHSEEVKDENIKGQFNFMSKFMDKTKDKGSSEDYSRIKM